MLPHIYLPALNLPDIPPEEESQIRQRDLPDLIGIWLRVSVISHDLKWHFVLIVWASSFCISHTSILLLHIVSFIMPFPHIRESGLGDPPMFKCARGVEIGFHSFAIWQRSPLHELWLLDSATRRLSWWRKSRKLWQPTLEWRHFKKTFKFK